MSNAQINADRIVLGYAAVVSLFVSQLLDAVYPVRPLYPNGRGGGLKIRTVCVRIAPGAPIHSAAGLARLRLCSCLRTSDERLACVRAALAFG
jgi:hypothetical protein